MVLCAIVKKVIGIDNIEYLSKVSIGSYLLKCTNTFVVVKLTKSFHKITSNSLPKRHNLMILVAYVK